MMEHPTERAEIGQLRQAVRKKVHGSREQRACYRALCLLLIFQGQKASQVASLFGEHTRTLERWRKRFLENGLEGLTDETSPGRPCRLDDSTQQELANALRQRPRDFGMDGQHWQGRHLQQLLKQHYQVDFSLRQCQRLLKKLRAEQRQAA